MLAGRVRVMRVIQQVEELMFEFDASSSITLKRKLLLNAYRPNCCNIFKFKRIQHCNVKL